MHAASLDKSPRLQRVLAVLKDGKWHSTRDIMLWAQVCAVNSCISELRHNGVAVQCQQQGAPEGRIFLYQMEVDNDGKPD